MDIDLETVLIFIVSSYLAFHTYEYLQYTAFGQFVGRFLSWFADYESKIWIDGFIIITIGATLMSLVPIVLILFWGFLIIHAYDLLIGLGL